MTFKVEFFKGIVARVDWLNSSLIFDSHNSFKKLTQQTTQRTRLISKMLQSALVGFVAWGIAKGVFIPLPNYNFKSDRLR